MATTRFADHLLTGTHASRPAASAVPAGTLYSCTTHSLIYQSDGSSAWSTYATLGGTETLPASIIDAKGDVIAGTANDTAARLAVGSDGQVLTADAASTPGVKWAAAAASGAMTLLSTTTLGSPAATLDVSSISGSYNDLILMLICRSAIAGTNIDSLGLTFNNDTASNYSTEYIEVTGTTAVSGSQVATSTRVVAGRTTGATSASNLFSVSQYTVPGYAGSVIKGVLFEGWAPTALSAGGLYTTRGGGAWNSTAAITRVTFALPSSGANFATGSTLRIYGRL